MSVAGQTITPLQTSSATGANITSLLTLSAGNLDISTVSRIQPTLTLSSMNGAAATITVKIINVTDTTTVWRESIVKDAAAHTGMKIVLPPFLSAVKVYGIAVLSSNASDTSVTWTIDWCDLGNINANKIGGTTQSAGDLAALIGNIAITGSPSYKQAGSFTVLDATCVEGGTTYALTDSTNNVYHTLIPDTTSIDGFYQFTLGGDEAGVSLNFKGRLYSSPVGSKNIVLQAWDWTKAGADTWANKGVTIMTIAAVNTDAASADVVRSAIMVSKYTGTGANLGVVKIRAYGGSLVAANVFSVDQLVVGLTNTSRSVGYADGSVWVDTVNGTAGVEAYVNGTADKPVLTWADALTIAASVGVDRFHISSGSSVTLTSSGDDSSFFGPGSVALGNQSIADAEFVGMYTVSGLSSDCDAFFRDCGIGDVSVEHSYFSDCRFKGELTMLTGDTLDWFFINCSDTTPGGAANAASFVYVASASVVFRNWRGGITIKSHVTGNSTVIDGAGRIIIDASSTGGTITIRGNFPEPTGAAAFIAAGGTITQTQRYGTDQIADSVDASTAGIRALLALPAAAPDAAGGLPISDAGGLDLDALYRPSGRRTLHVAKTGNDGNTGLSFVAAKLTVGGAIAAATDGDEIVVHANATAYTESAMSLASLSGVTLRIMRGTTITSGETTVLALGESCSVCGGGKLISTKASGGIAVYATDKNNLSIEDVWIVSSDMAIVLANCTNIRITNIAIDSAEYGVWVTGNSDNLAMDNCFVTLSGWTVCAAVGVTYTGSLGRITNCDIGVSVPFADGNHIPIGIESYGGSTDSLLIEHCNIQATALTGDYAYGVYATGGKTNLWNCRIESTADSNAIDIFNDGANSITIADSHYSTTTGTITRLDPTVDASGNAYADVKLVKAVDADTAIAARVDASTLATDLANFRDMTKNSITAGTVDDGSPAATSFVTDLAEATNDHYKNRIIEFTSGNLLGQGREITGYNAGTKTITVNEAFTEAPANADTFQILGYIAP